ncbi:LPXTG-domain-containing protein cell wall anchor domain [Enterococcus quebecensis]|nr:LPXTG-domain-containing protein cell wall anchor domain [Enterococcus quebecensis]
MFVGVLGLFGFSDKSLAAELNSGGFVDTIQFEKTELMDGELTSIRVTFSEKPNTKLKAGDELTLSLPEELEGLTESGGIPREIDLNGLGITRVYKDKIVCTFNEKVNQLDRVRGEFTFGVRVTNVEENTVKEIPANLGTSVTIPNIVVNGRSGDGEEGQLPFFYKTGDLLGKSGQIRWFLCANLTKSDLANDLVLTDKSGSGQTLNKDSFVFTVDNYLGQSNLSLEEFENQGYGTVDFGSGNDFSIRIYRRKARLASFTIMYTATMTDAGKKQAAFTNDCQIDYQILYQKPSNEQATHKVKNIFLDGNATGDENQLIKEGIQEEEIIEDESSKLEEITPLDPEKVVEGKQEDLNKAKKEQPEIYVDEQVEHIEDELDELEEIQPIDQKQAKENKEEELNKAKEEQPKIYVDEQIEHIEDESSELEEIQPIDQEQAKESKEEELNKAKEEQPEIHVGEQIETNEDESSELEEIQPIDQEQAKESKEEELNKAKEEQPEIHVGEQIETNEDESSELEEIQPIDQEQAKESKEEELNKAKEEQPEINVGEQIETNEDESSELERIKPLEPETVDVTEIPVLEPKITGNKVDVHQDKSVKDNIVPSGQIEDELTAVKEEKKQPKADKLLLNVSKNSSAKEKAQLPKAGSKDSYVAMIAGFAVITLTLGAFVLNRKKVQSFHKK